MAQNIPMTTNDDEELGDRDLFTKIWTQPRRVFRYVNERKYDKYKYVLLFLAGVSSSLEKLSRKSFGEDESLIGILFITVIVGGALGWISFWMYAGLTSIAGDWFKGKGNTTSILRIFSYAMIPAICAMGILFLEILIYGTNVLKDDNNLWSGWANTSLLAILTISQVILGIWTLVLFIVGVSEVQKISKTSAIFNLVFAFLMIFIPILLIVGLIFLLNK